MNGVRLECGVPFVENVDNTQKSTFTWNIINNTSAVSISNYVPVLLAGNYTFISLFFNGDNFCNLEISFLKFLKNGLKKDWTAGCTFNLCREWNLSLKTFAILPLSLVISLSTGSFRKNEFLRLHCSAFHVQTYIAQESSVGYTKVRPTSRERRLFACGRALPRPLSWRRSFSFLLWNSRNARQILFRKEVIHAKRDPCADGTSGTDRSSDALHTHISCVLTCALIHI